MDKGSIKLPNILSTSPIWSMLLLFFFFSLNYSLATKFFQGFNSYDIQRILELILLIGVATWVLVSPLQKHATLQVINKIPSSARYLLLFIFTWGIISSLLSPLVSVALTEVALYTLLFWFAITIAAQQEILNKWTNTILITLILFAVIHYSFYFLYFYLHLMWINPEKILLSFPGFVALRFFSEFQIGSLAILTLPLYFLGKKNFLYKILFFILSIFWWSLAIFNGSKGLGIACTVAMITVAILFKKNARGFLLIQLSSILGAFLLSYFLFLTLPNWLNHQTSLTERAQLISQNNTAPLDSSFEARVSLWKEATQLIKQHYFFGVGPQHFSYYPYLNNYGAHPHNTILLFASEWGLPAIATILLLVLWGFHSWVTQIKPRVEITHIALTFSFIAALIFSLCGGLVVTPVSQVMLAILLGWMLSCYQTHSSFKVTVGLTGKIFIVASCLFSGIIMTFILFLQVPSLKEKEISWYFSNQTYSTFRPRFWMQGWIYHDITVG